MDRRFVPLEMWGLSLQWLRSCCPFPTEGWRRSLSRAVRLALLCLRPPRQSGAGNKTDTASHVTAAPSLYRKTPKRFRINDNAHLKGRIILTPSALHYDLLPEIPDYLTDLRNEHRACEVTIRTQNHKSNIGGSVYYIVSLFIHVKY